VKSFGGNHENRKHALAWELARGATVRAAAKAARVSEKSAHVYRKEPGFPELVRAYRGEIYTRAISRLCGLGGRAAVVLGKLLADDDARIRLGAAKAVLEAAAKGREALDVEERLSQLEAALAQRGRR
jgi:hypothetical protein